MNTINVFIPAAGFGERLRPVTDHIPKPMMPILGSPVLERIMKKVSVLKPYRIGVNLHYKKDVVKDWIASSSYKNKTAIFVENVILGTGGALKNAESLLSQQTFLVHNSDILSDIDLEALIKRHRTESNLVTLAVHDYPEFNSVLVDRESMFRGVKGYGASSEGDEFTENPRVLAFTGIAVYEPGFLNYLHPGKSSVVDAWIKAVSAGERIGIVDFTGCCWNDIGTPSAYASAVMGALRIEGEHVYLHPSLENCANTDITGNVVVEEGCEIGGALKMKNCICLPNTRVGADYGIPLQRYENCIAGPGYKIELDETAFLCIEGGNELIGTGGSDRKYYRIKVGSDTAVLMKCTDSDPDFERHIKLTDMFLNYHVPVPQMLSVNHGEKSAEFEDAGDMSLYSYLRCPRDKGDITALYKRVLDGLARIHCLSEKYTGDCEIIVDRIFDYDHFRWETAYFLERFVQGIKNIETADNMKLQDELDGLALKADSYPKTIIHRDFQSQNLMVPSSGEIRIIDFQGARMGPPAYDVASILWDPYCEMKGDMRESLLEYYIVKMNYLTENRFDSDLFRDSLLPCRLQRHMQALGAYGYLSSVKGKKYFLKHVQEGLRLLHEDVLEAGEDFPFLRKIIMRL